MFDARTIWVVMLGGSGNAIQECQLLSLGIFHRLVNTFLHEWAQQRPTVCNLALSAFPGSPSSEQWAGMRKRVWVNRYWVELSGSTRTVSLLAVLPSSLFSTCNWTGIASGDHWHLSLQLFVTLHRSIELFSSSTMRHITMAVKFSQVEVFQRQWPGNDWLRTRLLLF